MKKGATEFITENDLPGLVPSDEATALGSRLTKAMEKQCVPAFRQAFSHSSFQCSSSLWVALFVAYGGPYAFALGLKIIQDSLAYLQPQLLRWLLSYISTYQSSRVSDDGPTTIEGFAIAVIMFMASVAQTIILHQVCSDEDSIQIIVLTRIPLKYFQRCFETGMRVRSGLITAIYQKALVLSNDGRSSASGDIVNLMSVDAARLQELCTYGLIAISGPFQVCLSYSALRLRITHQLHRLSWHSCRCTISWVGPRSSVWRS